MNKNWLAVASAEHVRQGRKEGFMQVCHGKLSPLKRLKPDDCVVYYSPTVSFRGTDKLQSFTAIGIVLPGEPYPFDRGDGFQPFRRTIRWAESVEASIVPLLQELDFTKNNKNWGYQLRWGLIPISEHDKELIAHAMHV